MSTTQEKIAVMQAHIDGSRIQGKADGHKNATWRSVSNPSWNWDEFDYRVAPAEPMSIPWHLIKREYEWAAADSDGRIWVYTHKPNQGGATWLHPGTIAAPTDKWKVALVDHLILTERGDTPWHETLTQRPE